MGDYESAIAEARRYRETLMKAYPENPSYVIDFYAHMQALTGEVEQAEEALREAEHRPDGETLRQFHEYYAVQGAIARARGDLDEAVIFFEKALEEADFPYLHLRSILAEAYLEVGRHDLAVAALEKALSSYDEGRALSTIRAATAYYLLGMAYEASGWNEKAIEQYETFLDLWKDADPGIPVAEDARERLARLKASS
jgi:tetratricopeptide (TPR) repeat protein